MTVIHEPIKHIQCTRCKLEQPTTNFYKSKGYLGMLWCKTCCSSYQKHRRKNRLGNRYKLGVEGDIIRTYFNMKQSSCNRKLPMTITRDQFIAWYIKTPKECHYCSIPQEICFLTGYMRKSPTNKLTMDRSDNSKGYEIDNIVFSCFLCNSLKSDFFTEHEMKNIAINHIKPKWIKLQQDRLEGFKNLPDSNVQIVTKVIKPTYANAVI